MVAPVLAESEELLVLEDVVLLATFHAGCIMVYLLFVLLFLVVLLIVLIGWLSPIQRFVLSRMLDLRLSLLSLDLRLGVALELGLQLGLDLREFVGAIRGRRFQQRGLVGMTRPVGGGNAACQVVVCIVAGRYAVSILDQVLVGHDKIV